MSQATSSLPKNRNVGKPFWPISSTALYLAGPYPGTIKSTAMSINLDMDAISGRYRLFSDQYDHKVARLQHIRRVSSPTHHTWDFKRLQNCLSIAKSLNTNTDREDRQRLTNESEPRGSKFVWRTATSINYKIENIAWQYRLSSKLYDRRVIRTGHQLRESSMTHRRRWVDSQHNRWMNLTGEKSTGLLILFVDGSPMRVSWKAKSVLWLKFRYTILNNPVDSTDIYWTRSPER